MYDVVSQKFAMISVQIFLKERLTLTGKRTDGVAGGRAEVLSFCIQDHPCVFLNIKHYQSIAEDPT